MKVRAINNIGYYGHIRRYPVGHAHVTAGEIFEISDPRHFSKKWMEVVEDAAVPVPSAPPPAAAIHPPPAIHTPAEEKKGRGRPKKAFSDLDTL
jgi:hypothetical protein